MDTRTCAREAAMPAVNEEPQSNVEISSEGCARYDALGGLSTHNWSNPRGATAQWYELRARVAVGTVPTTRTVVIDCADGRLLASTRR